jgi:uncharacterized protein YjeT (DUF2065 family)
METAIEKMAALSFIVVGLSHIFRPRVWAQFFTDLARRGETASLYVVLMHLPVGTLIVAFHNVWHWPGVVLTVIGWGYVAKSLVYGLFPAFGLRMLSRVSTDRASGFIVPGLLLTAYGGWLAYRAFGA